MPVAQLERSITEQELQRWRQYAARYMLPTRRLQMQLALIGMWVAQLAGHKEARFDHFLFDPPPPEPKRLTAKQRKAETEQAKAAIGFNPRKKVKRPHGKK